ncbi:MAG: 30S ribosomal protein S16 [Planctomycetota bacterium]|jgi:small subunit ribosomal protein S16|nr:30S ribosomal protein S16 [Planctomycetota bacterium]
MAVKIRLQRLGRTHKPYYRVVATDGRRKRSGEACEILGVYDPTLAEKTVQVDMEQVHKWIRNGADYSEGAASILKHAGYELYPAEVLEARAAVKAKLKKRRQERKKSGETAKGTYVKPTRRALNKHKAKLKAVRMAELAKEQEAKAKAAAEAEAAAAAAAEAEAPAEEATEG